MKISSFSLSLIKFRLWLRLCANSLNVQRTIKVFIEFLAWFSDNCKIECFSHINLDICSSHIIFFKYSRNSVLCKSSFNFILFQKTHISHLSCLVFSYLVSLCQILIYKWLHLILVVLSHLYFHWLSVVVQIFQYLRFLFQ